MRTILVVFALTMMMVAIVWLTVNLFRPWR